MRNQITLRRAAATALVMFAAQLPSQASAARAWFCAITIDDRAGPILYRTPIYTSDARLVDEDAAWRAFTDYLENHGPKDLPGSVYTPCIEGPPQYIKDYLSERLAKSPGAKTLDWTNPPSELGKVDANSSGATAAIVISGDAEAKQFQRQHEEAMLKSRQAEAQRQVQTAIAAKKYAAEDKLALEKLLASLRKRGIAQ